MENLLENFSELKIASGYMAFPYSFIKTLKNAKSLDLLCASPQANGFLGDGIKNWIPYMYRCLEKEIYNSLPQAKIYEYTRDMWTFHSKGIWASDKSGTFYTSIGSSNFSGRSYNRDTEFQLHL